MQRKVLAGIACSVPAGKIMAATPDSIMSRRPYLAQASRAVDDAVLQSLLPCMSAGKFACDVTPGKIMAQIPVWC